MNDDGLVIEIRKENHFVYNIYTRKKKKNVRCKWGFLCVIGHKQCEYFRVRVRVNERERERVCVCV